MPARPATPSLAAFALACLAAAGASAAQAAGPKPREVQSVEFVGMAAPRSPEQRARVYSEAKVRLTWSDGAVGEFPLAYRQLHDVSKRFGGVTVGDLYDATGRVLLDGNGRPRRSETPDANSLIEVPGALSDDPRKRRLFLVTHHEYDWIDSAGAPQRGGQPMTMNLATVDQDVETGRLETVTVRNIDMAGVGGLWTPCAGSLSPWNTHLGSEEYEPDARCQVDARCARGAVSLDAMNRYLDPSGATQPARVYDYGLTPEVTVDATGNASVVKHRTLGRLSREQVEVMPDQRTVYQGDDGTYTVLAMFVADRAADLSAGTLYAAKWRQTSDAHGGAATLSWSRLGHATDAELQALVDGGIRFSDIFELSATAAPGFITIKAGHSGGLIEHLKLRPGMEQAAAFLETRRYAAYVGATAELEKLEGVAVNRADRKIYLAISRIGGGMEDNHQGTEPANHVALPRLGAGAVYEADLRGGQSDSSGGRIDSDHVAVAIRGLVVGTDMARDAAGNTAAVDAVANPDNVEYSEKMRVLFIGEDSKAHINNFLWAYHVDTGRLARILSLPAGAESTGLQVLDGLNGHAYVMSNYQHAGEHSPNIDPALEARLEPLIDRHAAGIGYVGGLPALR